MLASAPVGAAPPEQDLKQANNPLAKFSTINFQNYYVPELSDTDGTANTFWARYARPIEAFGGTWLMRASVPLQRVPTATGNESGLGAINAFATYLFDTKDPAVSFGVGPLLALPTSTGDVPGGDTWDLGAAVVYFDARSDLFQYGGLVTYQTDVAGSGESEVMAVQPFGIFQLGGGWYLRSTGAWVFNLETNDYSVPIGFGAGRVIKSGRNIFNMYLEPQFSVLSDGPGQPEFQIFAGFNIQTTSEKGLEKRQVSSLQRGFQTGRNIGF
jgi:hypothetical protein